MSAPSRLEQRYRRVLRLLPAPYRLAWEEEMVATFLATMDSGRTAATAPARPLTFRGVDVVGGLSSLDDCFTARLAAAVAVTNIDG